MQRPILATQSDYGTADGRAAALSGNILKIAPEADIYSVLDLYPEGDALNAGGMIYSVLPFFPEGTVYVSMVEDHTNPSRAVALKTKCGRYIVAPDNGTVTAWLNVFGAEKAVALDEGRVPAGISTYAYYGAKLAQGGDIASLGCEVSIAELNVFNMRENVVKDGYVECGLFSVLKNFGNLNLNVRIDEFANANIAFGDAVRLTLTHNGEKRFEAETTYERSFGYVEFGKSVLFNGSSGYMGMGLNQKSFAAAYIPEALLPGTDISGYIMTIERI